MVYSSTLLVTANNSSLGREQPDIWDKREGHCWCTGAATILLLPLLLLLHSHCCKQEGRLLLLMLAQQSASKTLMLRFAGLQSGFNSWQLVSYYHMLLLLLPRTVNKRDCPDVLSLGRCPGL
jgi:hypothetical protein